MCTVTYLPLKNGFIITSNRDESLLRKPAEIPKVEYRGGVKILFPRDGDAGGTWIATGENGRTVCLLNGAFVHHRHQPPYHKSRGLVVLDFFGTKDATEFVGEYDLAGVEPFTLLIAEYEKLYEMRWSRNEKYFKQLNEKEPAIRSSVTLYRPEITALREKWFNEWLKTRDPYQVLAILHFHLFTGEGDKTTNLKMSGRGLVHTVSVTSVESTQNNVRMYYAGIQEEKKFYFGSYSFNAFETPQGLTITLQS